MFNRFVFAFSARVLAAVFGFFITVLISRRYGIESLGHYSLFVLLLSLADIILGLGLPSANYYFGSKNLFSRKTIITASLLLPLAASLLLFGAVRILEAAGLTGAGIFAPYTRIIKQLPPLFFAYTASSAINGLYLAEKRISVYSLFQYGTKAVLFGLLLLFSFSRRSFQHSVYISYLVLYYSVLAYMVAAEWKNLTVSGMAAYVKKCVPFGLYSAGSNIISFMNYRFDYLLVSAFWGLKQLGYYSIAVGLAEAVWHIPSAFGISAMSARTDVNKDPSGYQKKLRLAMAASLACIAVLAVSGKGIILLFYGRNYLVSYYCMLALLAGAFAFCVPKAVASVFIIEGNPQVNTMIALGVLIVNTVLNFLLIPGYGIMGASIATSLSYIAAFAATAFYYRRLLSGRREKTGSDGFSAGLKPDESRGSRDEGSL